MIEGHHGAERMSTEFRVVITDFLGEAAVEASVLEGLAEVVLARCRVESELYPYLPEADVLIVYHEIPMMTEAIFARAPRCRGAIRAGVGFNNIDLLAAGRHGIVVCNVPDYGTEEVADHAMLL